ncbi:MAG: C40 family peptidase [Anaerotignum sp.]|nr:C40 family peptidase [Anaerotignum sp.]
MNNLELVRFAKSKLGTPYVYGMKGTVLTEKQYDRLKILFGDLVWDSDRKKIGQVCVDCSGLISWATGIHRNSRGYHDTAELIFPISTVKEAPVGAALWCEGHIGIYLGDGRYIAADGSRYGVRIAAVKGSSFTHWFLLKDIEYREEEMVTKESIIYNDQKYTVEMIRKDGVTYLKTRDIANVLGLSVGSRGKTPVLMDKKGSAV